MPIDLQNPTNIGTGWGPPPQFHAPEIGGLVGHILQNRILQRAQQDKEIADAIKNIQSQKEDAAYIKAAQDAGLLPAGDYSGLGAKTGESIADLLNKRKAEESLAAYRAALAGEAGAHGGLYQTQADYINKYGTTPGRGGGRGGRGGSFVTVTDDNGDPVLDANGDPVQVPAGSKLGQHIISQQNAMLGAPSASVAANIATKMGIPPQAVTDTGTHQGMGFVPGSGVNARGEPYQSQYLPVSPGDEPTDIKVSPTGVDPKTQQPYQPVIVQKDTLEQLRRALQGSSYKPPRGPQPGDVNDQVPLPQSGRLNASKGAPVNVPQAGDVVAGYKFQGGDPNDRTNWVPVN